MVGFIKHLFRLFGLFKFKIYHYVLLLHELAHAKKINECQNKYKAYIVLGKPDRKVKPGDGEKRWANYEGVNIMKLFGFNIYLLSNWKCNIVGVTDIEDRNVLSKKSVKKAIVNPLKEGVLLIFCAVPLLLAALMIVYNKPFTISFYTLLIIALAIALVGLAEIVMFFCSSNSLTSDMKVFKKPSLYYTCGGMKLKKKSKIRKKR